MTKRAMIFDLDGTLLLDRKSPYEHFVSYCARLGHPLNGDSAAKLERWSLEYWSRHDEIDSEVKSKGDAEFWLQYNVRQLEFLQITGPLAEYALKIDTWFREEYGWEGYVPDDVRPTLNHFRQQGMVVGLITNRINSVTNTIADHNLTDLFDFTLTAGETGHWKPKPTIFEMGLAMVEVTPENATYVGDNYYADVMGARAAGLTPILIDRRGLFPNADCRVIKAIGELVEETVSSK
jgi:putative hydrolase of the HAD superfamily